MICAEEGLSARGFEVTRLNTYNTVSPPPLPRPVQDLGAVYFTRFRVDLTAACPSSSVQVPVSGVDQGILEEAASAPVLAVASPSAVRSDYLAHHIDSPWTLLM